MYNTYTCDTIVCNDGPCPHDIWLIPENQSSDVSDTW